MNEPPDEVARDDARRRLGIEWTCAHGHKTAGFLGETPAGCSTCEAGQSRLADDERAEFELERGEINLALSTEIRARARAEEELGRLGFRRCDVASCNCGGYHQHRQTVIESSLAARAEALKKERDHWREEHEHRRGETLAALMVEKAAQDRAEVVTCERNEARAEVVRMGARFDLLASLIEALRG